MRNSRRLTLTVLVATVMLTSCADRDDRAAPLPTAGFTAVLSTAELMTHVIQPAAFGVWRRQGRTYSIEGETSLFPKDANGWEEAEESAATLAELTNVLLIPTRNIEDDHWTEFVHQLRRAAISAMDAAERHTEDAFFEAGGRIQEACEACHDRYLPKTK